MSARHGSFRHEVFNIISSSALRLLATFVATVALSVGMAALSLVVGVYIATRNKAAAIYDPSSVAAMCGELASSGQCTGRDLISIATVGGLIAYPVFAIGVAIAAATTEELIRGAANGRYHFQLDKLNMPGRVVAGVYEQKVATFDRVLADLGWVALAPLAIWAMPFVIIHGAVSSAAGGEISALWPHKSLGSLVKSTSAGAALVGFVVFVLVASTCVLLTCLKVELPFAPHVDDQVTVIDKPIRVESAISQNWVSVDIDGGARDLPRYSPTLMRRLSCAKAPIDGERDVAADDVGTKK